MRTGTQSELICHESGRERPDRDAGQQIAHDRGQADQARQVPGDERCAERDGDGGDEIRAVGFHENPGRDPSP